MTDIVSTAPSNQSSKTVAKRILTGITPTGIPHLGNYVGAIRPAIQSIQNSDDEAFFFLPDYHGIIKCQDPAVIHESSKAIRCSRDTRVGLDSQLLLCQRAYEPCSCL